MKEHRINGVPRRIVTGHDEHGRSVIVSSGATPSTSRVGGGAEFFEIWSTLAAPSTIEATVAEEPTAPGASVPPPSGGSRVRVVDFPAGAKSPMHRTRSIDYGIVIAGELVMVLDDGSETELRAGDVVVQRGTNHLWDNRSDGVAIVAFVLLDAEFSAGLLASLPEDVERQLIDRPPAA